MDIHQFVAQSLGRWKSQRSAHHLVFRHFEAVESVIDITPISPTDPAVQGLCERYGVAPETIVSPFHMCWEGTSDWDETEELKGSTVLVPVPDPQDPRQGQLLRDQGYAETVPAAGRYHFTDDDTFVLISAYDHAAAEEKIWFVNPNLRFRVSLIKTSQGSGVVTASFASEVRDLSAP
ncbi:MAG: phycobiliprotein lyase [Thermosynechococcaceae cyanobacterium]